jgi:hypothetical protein
MVIGVAPHGIRQQDFFIGAMDKPVELSAKAGKVGSTNQVVIEISLASFLTDNMKWAGSCVSTIRYTASIFGCNKPEDGTAGFAK